MIILILASMLSMPQISKAVSYPILYDSDVRESLRVELEQDFDYLSSLKLETVSPIHRDIFGMGQGDQYRDWLFSRVKRIGYDRCGSSRAIACVKTSIPNKIFLTPTYVGRDAPRMARLMTLYHEARHTEKENDHWGHWKCPRNFPYRSIWTNSRLARKSACDGTEFGSYSSAAVLMSNLYRFCVNCSERDRLDAKLYAEDQSRRLIVKDAKDRLMKDFEQQI